MWFKGLAAAGFVLAATQVSAQAYHFETSKFIKPLAPNEELHALKGCDSGALVSGGFQILNNASRFAVTKSYPSHFALTDQWRVDVRNISDSVAQAVVQVHVVCTGAKAKADKVNANERIFFSAVSHVAPNGRAVQNIFASKADGTAAGAITSSAPDKEWDNFDARISPSGDRMVFASMRHRDDPTYGNETELYLADSDGSNEVRLSANFEVYEESPSWCGADRILLSQGGDIVEIDAADTDGDMQGDNHSVVVASPADEYAPDCSSDGQQIVFLRQDGPLDRKIILGNRDGSGLLSLGGVAALNEMPRFSPDGSMIAFASNRDNANTGIRDIYVMDAQDQDGDGVGDNLRRLTISAAGSGAVQPVWAPDGSKILFLDMTGASATLHTVDVATTGVSAPITTGLMLPFASDWID